MRFLVLGLIIPCGIRVSGHVVQPFTGIRHRKSLTEKTWKHAVQGKADHAYVDFCIISKEANPSQLQRIL